jgi:DNA invertase Pin-like site-specific DNA recombinase
MINAVAYFRINANEKDEAKSRNANIAFFENYASQNNLNLICIYSDSEIPNLQNRVAFNRMIEDYRTAKNAFDIVLIKKSSPNFFMEDICADIHILDDNKEI